ncbi:hypothetical protein BOX15_Mlig032504g2, partial [Macrostomum lignano]
HRCFVLIKIILNNQLKDSMIRIRILHGRRAYLIDCPPWFSVLQLKQRVHLAIRSFPETVTEMKLIFKAEVLQDVASLYACGVTDNDVLVLINVKEEERLRKVIQDRVRTLRVRAEK